MVRYCVAFGCSETYKKGSGIQFHRFPRSCPKLLKSWENAIRRKNWKSTVHSTLCSKHFTEESYQVRPGALVKRLKDDAVPSVFSFTREKENRPTRRQLSFKTSQLIETSNEPDTEPSIESSSHTEPMETEQPHLCGDFSKYLPLIMGPKLKKISLSGEDNQERKKILARERQRRRRAKLIGGEVDEAVIERERELGKERQRRRRTRLTGDQYLSLTESDIVSLKGSTEKFQETPEEISVEVEIKEECLTEEEDENTHNEEPKSEFLPGPKGQVLYYDGVGYYYNQLDEDVNTRWLQCSHADCSTLAQMKRDEGAPIRLVEGSTPHHHPPNSERRDRIIFLHRIKTRHASEHTPFSVIFQQESYRNPVGASFFSFDKIQAHLQKKIKDGSENLSQESVLSAASTLSMMSLERPSPPAGPVAKKMKTDHDPPAPSGKLSKKLEILKSLKDVSFTECETNEPTSEPPKPSERLPGPHPLSYVYHDGYGYFYKPLSISGNTRYLQCNSAGCHAQGVMALEENSPISLGPNSPSHNHPPQKAQSPKRSVPPVQQVVICPVKITLSGGKKKENKMVVEEGENQEAKKKQTGKISLKKIPEVHTRKQSERIQGPEYYYDFKGHYYFTTRCEKNKRYLRCLFPTCIAEAVMTMEDNAEIQPVSGSRPHNHQPDETAKPHIKIKQWEEQWAECLPSERLPSLRVQYCCYHDGRGYYYHQTSQSDNIRYLACSEPGCPVKGHMCTQKDAPITLSGLRPSHSHGPDHTLRDALLFIDAVRVRARSDNDPANAITLETTRNPVGAGRVDLETLQHCLETAAEITSNKSKEGIVEDEVDFAACVKPQKSVIMLPSTESQVPVYNHFASPRPMVVDRHIKTEEETTSLPVAQTKSELIPALLSDSWLYHDGSGYYYTTINMNHGFRYLQCVSPKCGVRGLVGQAGGPVKLQKPHSHGAQPPQHRVELWFFHKIKIHAHKNPDAPLSQIYREVAEKDPEGAALISEAEVLQLMDKFLISIIQGNNSKNLAQNSTAVFSPLSTQAEKLPSTTLGRYQYHDSQGFYYTVDKIARKPRVIYLKCISRVTCRARATLVDGKVTMIANTKHNHKPDQAHRDICVFTHTLKKRARDENTPVSVIYQEEAKKYPKAAAILREDRLKGKLTSIRKYVQREINVQTEEGEFEDSQNGINQSRLPCAASEVIPGKMRDVHHDGRGFYYHETFATNKLKYLMCCEPHCLAQAKKERKAGAPVVEEVGAPRHCHAPDPLRRDCLVLVDNIRRRAAQRNVKFETIYQQETAKLPLVAAQIPKMYLSNLVNNIRISAKKGAESTRTVQDKKEEDELWCFSEPCERLPSEHGWVYYNEKGYFYYSHESHKSHFRRVLRCCENGCDATAWLDGLQITRAPGSVLHNHTPEPRRRHMLLLLHRVAIRAQLEHASVADIFAEEAKLDSEGAALIPKNKLNETFHNLTVGKYFKDLEEEELSQKVITGVGSCSGDEVTIKPCEALHSASSGKPVYHDSEGHYFTELLETMDRQYVKCLMPLCEAQGYIVLSDPWDLHIPLSWGEHNHKPDLLYRNKLLFIHNLRQRVLNEDTPVHIIYSDECEREPLGADLVSEVSIKNLMYKLRKSKSIGDEVEVFPYEAFSDDLSEHIGKKTVQKVFEPPLETQNDAQRIHKATEHREVQTSEPNFVDVKMEVQVAAAAGGDDEYTEEEYLEEERLEEEPVTESFPVNTNESSMQTDKVFLPSEKLPTRNNKSVYHDGQGYYFHFNALRENVMYLRCTEPRCLVRGIKAPDREDAPIIPTKDCVVHNHQPDFTRRTQLLFVHRCKLRAANEINLTISEIWDSEVERDPVTTSKLNAHNVKAQMKRYRLEHAANSDILSMIPGEVQADNAEDGITFQDASITDPLAENELLADIHQGAIPEKIPSLLGEPLWHAAGYFYSSYSLSPSIEKVKCVEKECVARAQVTLGDRGQPLGIKLIKNTVHCHSEDLNRRNQLLFIDRCKKRAATTLQSVEEIYYDEAAKAPEVASQLSAVRVKRAMGVAKKEKLKKGIRVDLKESEDSGDSGDHGMSELGEMANIVSISTPVVGHTEEVGAMEGGAHDDGDYYYPEESLNPEEEDLWTIDPRSLSSEEKSERKKAMARERQRRRRTRLMEDPDKWEQLEREKEQTRQRALAWQRQKKAKLLGDTNSTPKTPKLGPKFMKACVTNVKEEEYEEQEELVDEIYSDYVTLEEDLETYERDIKIEGGGYEGSNVSVDQSQEDSQLEEGETKNTKPSHLVHGRKINSYSYHDGNGFYYDTEKVSENYRHLSCVVVGCKAHGYMPLDQEDAPINLSPKSPAHFHPPDPSHKDLMHFVEKCEARALDEDEPLKDIYEEEAEIDPVSASKLVQEDLLQRMLKIRSSSLQLGTQSTEIDSSADVNAPDSVEDVMSENDEESGNQQFEENETERSEVLPGYRPNSTIYHDMKGYYFIFNALKENKRYLRCIEPRCRVRGSMLLYEGAPIRTSSNTVHNHRADFQRKDFVLFLKACKDRAVNEDLPLIQIYRQECKKDPVSAAMISTQNMLQRMQRARKMILRYYPTDEDQIEFSEACNSNTITTNIPPHELIEEEEEEDFQSQEEAYENIVAETVADEDDPEEEDPEYEVSERETSQLTNEDGAEDGSNEESVPEGGPVPQDQLQPSEALPGIRPNSTMYHDGRGYYYIFNNQSENVWYLRCLEPQCRVRAHMEPLEGSPIVQSPNTLHNHRPDYKRKQLALWMEQAKHRALTEDTPISIICAQEVARDPESASMISEENMRTRLYRARKSTLNKLSADLDDFELEDETSKPEILVNKSEETVTESEFDQVQDSEAIYAIQAKGSDDSNTVYVYQSPNNTHQQPLHVDDKGFCYHQTTIRNNTRYLKCTEAGCKARASMGLEEDSAITLSKQGCHNHTVVQSQLAMLLDTSGSDSAPIQVIYTDENGGEQVALCHIADEEELSKRPYRQRQKPDITIDPEEPPVDASVMCEVDVAEGDYYHNEDQQKYPLKPSEVIPGLRPDANNYHDGNGFYYELNRLSQNIRYLKCLIKDCKARAYMEVGKENAPIIQTNFARHNHGPDLSRKQFTVFLHRVTRRAAEEDTPIPVIYQQEAERDPQSARQIRMENVKQRMMRFRKKHRQNKMANQEASSSSEMDMDGSIYHFFMEDVNQELTHHEEREGKREGAQGEEAEGEEVLYESYVVSEVEVESQQPQI